MICTIKKCIAIVLLFSASSCIINNAKPKDCTIKSIVVKRVEPGSSGDIKLYDSNSNFYYINRGLEQGLTMEQMRRTVLNKKVTLHLYKFWFGVEGNHISQLTQANDTIFTEFKL